MSPSTDFHRKTTPTTDPDAIRFNNLFDDVSRFIEIGASLLQLLEKRFKGDTCLFRQWIRANLDRSELTLIRYMKLAQNADILAHLGIIRAKDAYRTLGLGKHVKLEP